MMEVLSLLKTSLDLALSFWFQTECVICHEDSLSGPLCSSCKDIFPIQGPVCEQCGFVLVQKMKCCGHCMQTPVPYVKKIRSGFWFKGSARRIMHLVKYSKHYQLMEVFKEACMNEFTTYFPSDVVLVPIPLHYSGYWKRGFNVSELITRWLSHAWGLKVCQNHLMKLKKTASQSTLSRTKRQSNLNKVFQWVGREPPPRTVLLVDDIYTTGATLRACAKTLLKSGSEEVYAWTLFRTQSRSS